MLQTMGSQSLGHNWVAEQQQEQHTKSSKSHTGEISYDIPYMQSLKINDTNELIKQRLTDLENEPMVARREGEGKG